jgi:tetratricopeptide (TPR) repeat protein
METFARAVAGSASVDLAAAAYCQLAIWKLSLGDRPRARESALKARPGKGTAAAALIARYLTEPPAGVAEWTARANRIFPDSGQQRTKNLALAYALLFAKEFQAAADTLENAYEHSAPDPQETLPVLLGWALMETGKIDRAARLLAHNPVPAAGADLLASLSFPRLFFLRGELAARQNKRDEANRNYRIFVTLSGPDPEIFEEEQRARHALGI